MFKNLLQKFNKPTKDLTPTQLRTENFRLWNTHYSMVTVMLLEKPGVQSTETTSKAVFKMLIAKEEPVLISKSDKACVWNVTIPKHTFEMGSKVVDEYLNKVYANQQEYWSVCEIK